MKLINSIRSAIDKVIQVKRHVCAFLLMVMLAVTFAQVFMRFVFRAPFSWSEEVTLMLLVWFGYICMSIDIYTDGHAALYFLYNKLPPLPKKLADLLRHGLLTWFFSQMVVYGLTITKLNLPKPQPATQFSQGWLFAPLVFGGICMTLYAFVNFVYCLLRPLDDYREDANREKSIDDLNVERGGTV